jgi:hypothetical protein
MIYTKAHMGWLRMSMIAAAILVEPGLASAEAPPVDVQVVVEDEDDFFEEKKEEKPKEDAAPEEQQQGGGKVRVEKKGSGSDNVNTQVVNIVVGGQKQESEAKSDQRQQEIESLEKDMSEARAKIAASKGSPKMEQAAPAQVATAHEPDGSQSWWKSWNKSPGVREGDVLFSVLGGRSSGGAFWGAALEVMLDDNFALRAKGFLDVIEGGRLRGGGGGSWNFSEDGIWSGLDGSDFTGTDHAVMHMVELQGSVHFRPKKRFDPYLTVGASHFGYWLESNDQSAGGSVYLRAGGGFNWFWKSVFAGLDLGWYPVEVLRYTAHPVEGSRGRRTDVEVVELDDRFDKRRITLSGHVGIRF